MPRQLKKPNITVTPSRKIITAREIKDHFNDPANITWVPLKSLLEDTPEQCVDGRSRQGIIGTPGGNMGEFILALDAAEKITNVWTRPQEVDSLFQTYLDRFGAFYMHTDTHGLHHLLELVSNDPQFKSFRLKSVKDLETLIRHPDKAIQPALLDLLTDPDNVGCGHLKLMLKFKDEYQVRRKLIKSAMKAYFRALWQDNPDLKFVVLDADHQEAAVITVLIDTNKLTPNTMIPTIASMGKKTQMFISHPQVEIYMRKKAAQEIATHKLIYGINQKNVSTYLDTIISRGQDFTRYTLSHLALGLPHYTVTLSQT